MTDYIVQEKKIDAQGQEIGNAFPITLTTAVFDGATKERLDVTLNNKANKSEIPTDTVTSGQLDEVRSIAESKASTSDIDQRINDNNANYTPTANIKTVNGQSLTDGPGNIEISGGGTPGPYEIIEWDIDNQGDTVILKTNSITVVKQVMTSGGIFTGADTTMTRAKAYFKVAAGTFFEFDDDSKVYGDFHEKVNVGSVGQRSNITFSKDHTIVAEYYDGGTYILYDVTGQEGRITAADIANFQTAEQVEQIVGGKDFATNTRVNEVEAKIPADTVTSGQLNEVRSIAESKASTSDIDQRINDNNANYTPTANIKTVNGQNLTDGPGNIEISGEVSSWNEITDKPDFKPVATSGSYNDLTDKPTIPAEVVIDSSLDINSSNPVANYAVSQALQKVGFNEYTPLQLTHSEGSSSMMLGPSMGNYILNLPTDLPMDTDSYINVESYSFNAIIDTTGIQYSKLNITGAEVLTLVGVTELLHDHIYYIEARSTYGYVLDITGDINTAKIQEIINQNTADFATNTRVNEVEAKIPTDTVTTEQLNAVKATAESKTTMVEVEAKGYTTLETVNQQGFAKTTDVDTKLSKKADSTRVDAIAASIPESWYGTQQEYDAIDPKDPTITYYIYE